MITNSVENPWAQRAKSLTQMLIVSVTLNIGLVATFVYFVVRDRQESLSIELRPVSKEVVSGEFSKEQFLYAYSLLPYQELLLRLESTEQVEEGLKKRDIALACLTSFHHFNLEKALKGGGLSKRMLSLNHADGLESIDVAVYPGLSDDQFQAVIRYARTEKWPLTSQGLFYELHRSFLSDAGHVNPDLLEAFTLSDEFNAVQTLFMKSGLNILPATLVEMLCQGDWNMITGFEQAQRQALDLSAEKRRQFLLQYIAHGAYLAAQMLLSTDLEYVIKHLDDASVLRVLELFQPHCPEWKGLALGLLASPRSDGVWKKSAEVLYALAQETLPEPYDHQQVLARFAPQLLPVKIEPLLRPIEAALKAVNIPVAIKKRLHKVEVGDSLWKIARRYGVSVEALMKINHLESDRLRIGKQLEIPERSL